MKTNFNAPAQEPSWLLTSKRMWGALIATLSSNLWLLGFVLPFDTDQETIKAVGAAGTQLIEAVGQVIGLVLMIVGSFKAKGGITIRPPKPAGEK